jgi:hypothetical protein
MAVEFTPVAGKIKDSRGRDRTIELKIGIDKNNPSNPPYIVDASNTNKILYQWNSTNKDWESTGSGSATLPVSIPSGGIQPTYDDFLNSNKQMFTENTTTVINKFSNQQKELWKESNTYQPYNTFVERSQAAAATATPSATLENLNTLAKEGIAGIPPRKVYGDYTYPKDIGSTDLDVIKFTMLQYGTKALNEKTLGFDDRKNKKITGSVVMAVQPTISDYNSVNWTGMEMGAIAQGAGGIGLEFIETGQLGSSADKILNTLNLEPGIKNAIIATIAQEAAGTKGLLSRITGAMLNPNLELLFQGPSLRPFNFSFQLSPRYKEESDEVRQIIRFFKQGSAVQRSTTGLFLKAPNVFDIEYLFRGANGPKHPSLNKIKTCALVNCAVDYTPTGSYMTFNRDDGEDGGMVSYKLSLTFNELEPVYEDEYNKFSNNDVGY